MSSPSATRSVRVVSRTAIPSDYLDVSKRPWYSLVFLLPLLVAFELGSILSHNAPTQLIAVRHLREFFDFFGATGRFIPALAIVGVLVACHIARRDNWEIRGEVLAGMLAESICWAVPLLGLGLMLSRYLPLSGSIEVNASISQMVIMSLGAGIYEELVFRLFGFAVCSFLLMDVLGVSKRSTALITLLITSIVFSLYHYLGWESPQWHTFVFRTVAGVFFGCLYLWRGFGVTAGAHAFYDVIVHAMRP